MGVDYNIMLAKKKLDGTIEGIFKDGLPILSPRWHQYQPLFVDKLKLIEKIANKKLNLDFYEKAEESYSVGINKNCTFNPKDVKSTIKIILKVIKENPKKFPNFYWVGFKGETILSESQNVFIGNDEVRITGGWDNCYYILNDKTVDLTKGKKEFSAFRVLYEKINDKWIDKKGENVTVVIKKCSFYEKFKNSLNNIIAICDYAIDHNYVVYSYLC